MAAIAKPVLLSISSPLLCSVLMSEKKITTKFIVYSDLKHKLRKRQKKVNKKASEVNKGMVLLHPQQRRSSYLNTKAD
jgi:hypothetical protein